MSKYLSSSKERVEHGLVVISYYADLMKVELLKLFESKIGLEELVDEICHSNGIRWDFRVKMDSTEEVTKELLTEWGEYFCSIGSLLQSMDEESYGQYINGNKYYTIMEDEVGFYLVELGMALESLSEVWKRVDTNNELEFEWEF